jgi:hypothetical protein
MAAGSVLANNHTPPRVPPRVGWMARPGVGLEPSEDQSEDQGDDMDALHRLAMVSHDPRTRGDAGEQPALGRPWLVISTLLLLALSAAVFLLC